MGHLRLLSILTLLGCLSSSVVFSASSSQDQQKALQALKNYNLFLSHGNGHLLRALKTCVEAKMNGRSAPSFLKKTSSITGRELSEEFTCENLLSKYFGYKDQEPFLFRKNFRLMQYHAILSQSGEGKLEDTESVDGAFLEKFSAYEHPARGTLDLFINQTVRMPKPEKIVWQKALESYQAFTASTCQDYLGTHQKLLNFRLKKFATRPFMKDLCSVITRKNNPTLKFNESWEIGIIKNSFTKYARKKRKEWKKTHLEEYYDVIASNPHFLLLDSRVLGLPQMRTVILRMMSFQEKSIARLRTLSGPDLLSLVPLLDQAEMTLSSKLSQRFRWSEGHTEEVIRDLRTAYTKAATKKGYIQIGGLVGAMVACQILPIGRAKLFVRSACMFSLGLPLDLYFITDATLQRIKTVQDFSRTPEAEFLFLKEDAIPEANKEILYNLIFMPLDIPAAGAVTAAKKLVRTAKR